MATRVSIVGKSETDISEPTLSGYYTTKTVPTYLYRCNECGLVWDKQWYANSCASRNHASSFPQRYGGRVENGQHVGYTEYIRQAVRRDRVQRPAAIAA